eukprot:1141796-Pelagomonas_calceolata.AAC.1
MSGAFTATLDQLFAPYVGHFPYSAQMHNPHINKMYLNALNKIVILECSAYLVKNFDVRDLTFSPWINAREEDRIT